MLIWLRTSQVRLSVSFEHTVICFSRSDMRPLSVCRLLSRSDIFKPLFQEDYEDFLEKEREAMATGQGVQATW